MSVRYQSVVKKIQDISLHQLDNNQTRCVVKIARVNRQMVAMTKDGKLYSNRVGIKNAFYTNTWDESSLNTVKCFVKLGLITKEEYAMHVENLEGRRKASDAEYALKNLNDLILEWGLKISKEEYQKIKNYIPKGK
ncbi:MAG: hypothetical protein QM489_00435 [Candidatus Izemoplasma sp.]